MGDCPKALSDAVFADASNEAYCSRAAGGFSLYIITEVPSAATIASMCSSSNCAHVIAAIKSAVPGECTTHRGFKLYAQILNPIAAGCGGVVTTPTTTTPAPKAPTTPTTTTPAPAPKDSSTPTAPGLTTAAPPTVTTATPSPKSAGSTTSSSSDSSLASSPSSGDGLFSSAGSTSGTNSPTSATGNSSSSSSYSSSSSSLPLNGTTINNNNASESSSASMPFIIGVVVFVVFTIAIIAFTLKRQRNKNRRDSKASLAALQYTPTGAGHATNGTYVEGLATATAGGSSGIGAGVKKNQPRTPDGAEGGAIGLWSDRAIQKARIPLEDIKLGKELSRGAFGEVFLGSYEGKQVAVKRLLPARRKDMKEIENFLEEAKLMTTLRHQRIVRLVGVAWDSLADLCVVSEFMSGGDLRTLLAQYDAQGKPTGFNPNKVKIAVHIVHALAYLHGLKPSVVHRDLKSKNILLSDTLDAKLTDFGVSRESVNLTMTAGVGSCYWMAPEVMVGDHYDEKADIFSFGVVLSELDTQQLPYAHANEPGTSRQLPEMAILQMVSQGTLKAAFSDRADAELVETARACMEMDPHDRPTANEVLHRLHHIWRSYGGLV